MSAASRSLENITKLIGNEAFWRVQVFGGVVRVFGFTTPSLVSLWDRYGDIILVDATYRCNQGSYILWHVMVMDCTLTARSVFYCFLSDETESSYKVGFSMMKELLPNSEKVVTVVLDRCMAQLNAVADCLPQAAAVFCRFHVIKNFVEKCRQLRGIGDGTRSRVRQWMKGLVYAPRQQQFHSIVNCVRSRCPEAYRYLKVYWLPYRKLWAGYSTRLIRYYGNLTTNRVERVNRSLKIRLKPNSSLITVVRRILNRIIDLDMTREIEMGLCATGVVVGGGLFPGTDNLLCPFTKKVRSEIVKNYLQLTRPSAERAYMDAVVKNSDGLVFHCVCPFHVQWDSPCRHLINVCLQSELCLSNLTIGNRWVHNQPRTRPFE